MAAGHLKFNLHIQKWEEKLQKDLHIPKSSFHKVKKVRFIHIQFVSTEFMLYWSTWQRYYIKSVL